MQNEIYKKVRRSVVYKKKQLDNRDMNRQKQNDVVDDLTSVTAQHQLMLHLKENAHFKEDVIEELNLSWKSDEQKNLIQHKANDKSDDEIDKEFQDEINKEQAISLKITSTVLSSKPETKKKFFELYKSEYKSKNNLAMDFESVYNSENLDIDLSPSKNQFIRIYDDMMNVKSNESAEKLSELRTKIFEFVKMNPVSIEIGDLIIRLGMKHLSLEPIDNKGALESFENAMIIYTKINQNMIDVLNSEKNTKSARKISEGKIGVNNKSPEMNNTPNHNNHNMNSITQYKFKAVKLRMSETLKKLADCYITEMDTDNAHKNISAAMKHSTFLFGDNSKEVADCIFKNAYITQLEQKWREATEIYNISLAIYKNVFRYANIHFTQISHIEIGDCYFKLGLIKEKQRNFNLSMEYYNMALAIYKNYFKGENNEECGLTMFNIGLLYEIQEINDKASKFYNQVRDIYAKIKPDSQDFIDILIKSANFSLIFKRYEEALTDLIQALTVTVKKNKCESFEELLEMVFVDSDEEYQEEIYYHFADLADICFLFSKIYSVPELNKHQEGFETLKILLALMPPHKDFIEGTDVVMKKLLENLNEKNYKAEWENDICDCIKQFILKMDMHVEENKRNFLRDESILEQSGENLDKTDHNSINANSNSHDVNQSEPNQKDEKGGVKKRKSNDEVSILFVTKGTPKNTFFVTKCDWLQTLGKNCSRIKLYKSAIELYLKCIVYLENVEDDAQNKNRICELMTQIAMEYTYLAYFRSAKVFFEKTLELRLKLHDKDDIRIASAYNNLAISYNKLGDNFKALEYWQRGMEIKKNAIKDEEDPRIAKDYYNFSIILFSMKEFDKAIEYMLDALYIFDKKLGKNSQFSADACLLLAESYKLINSNVNAVNYSTRAMTYYIDNFDDAHFNTIKSRLLFAICLSLTSKYDRAIVIFKSVIERFMNEERILRTTLFIEGIYEYAKCLDWTNKYTESLKYFEFFLENKNNEWSEERLKKVAAKIAQLKLTKPLEINRNEINDANYAQTPINPKPNIDSKQNLQANVNSRQITKKFSVVEDMERLKNRREERKKKLEEKNEAKIEASNETGVTKVDVDYENLITQKKLTIDKRLTQNHTTGDQAKILVCVRKRPMSSKEISMGEIDTVTCLNPRLYIHECKIKIDGITKYIEDHEFYFDNVFSESEATEDVYSYSIEPTIDLIMNKGIVTCFAYGQTGSGKTYTMKGIQNLAIDSIFDKAEKIEAKSNKQFNFFISFYEIYGGRLYDLLNNRNKLSVLEDKNQRVQIFGLEERCVNDAEEMREVIDLANSIRTTHNTVTNETSSRSHAICNILVREIDCEEVYGKLTLVDLAGSERAQETQCNEKNRRAEGAEINKSLLALKECIRALDARKNGNTEIHVPFRASKLTLVLRDSFMPKYDKAKIIMLACIAPDLASTNHTINTLRYSDRLKEKSTMIKNLAVANKAIVNPLVNSTSDITSNPKSYLTDLNTNEGVNKNHKANNKDFYTEKKTANTKLKNMIYEEFIEDKVEKLDFELINIDSSKNNTRDKNKKQQTSKNLGKNSKLGQRFNSENNKNLNSKITQKAMHMNKPKKYPYDKKVDSYKSSFDEGQYNSLEYIRKFTHEEENLIERHMRIIKDDAKFLTEEGDLLTNLKGIGPDNEILMDEYVKTLEHIINQKLTIYMDLKKKMEFCKKTGKRK